MNFISLQDLKIAKDKDVLNQEEKMTTVNNNSAERTEAIFIGLRRARLYLFGFQPGIFE